MQDQLLQNLHAWNPWWRKGERGIDAFRVPSFRRELFPVAWNAMQAEDNRIVSIVGMRQVGKTTILQQMIQDLLINGVKPTQIFYVSFDDPFLKLNFELETIFYQTLEMYTKHILGSRLEDVEHTVHFFFDEIQALTDWDVILKSYIGRPFPARYVISGSASLHIRNKRTETLLGRSTELNLHPFSFREYVAWYASSEKNHDEKLSDLTKQAMTFRQRFIPHSIVRNNFEDLRSIYTKSVTWHKDELHARLKEYIISGGFPKAWRQPNFQARQKVLWEDHVRKSLEDLRQLAAIRRPEKLEQLFGRLLGFNGTETNISRLKEDVGLSRPTVENYLDALVKSSLMFRIDKTKSKRFAIKRRSGIVKFYVTDVAIRNAFFKKDQEVINDENEMGLIAENLVCTTLARWNETEQEGKIEFFKSSGEVDFIYKHRSTILPIEVKWRNQIPSVKPLDRLVKKWELPESVLVTKDQPLTYNNGRLSIPLWLFLLCF